jgi:hypothetical protein
MAVSVESAGRVRQKAYNFIQQSTGTSTASVNPYHFYALKAFFLHWAANKNNADLQYLPYTAEQAIAAGGTDLAGGAATVYVWFAKGRRTSGTTSSWQELVDAAANSTDASVMASIRFKAAGDQFIQVFPAGLAFATAVTVAAVTIASGSVESSAADASDGFLLVTA